MTSIGIPEHNEIEQVKQMRNDQISENNINETINLEIDDPLFKYKKRLDAHWTNLPDDERFYKLMHPRSIDKKEDDEKEKKNSTEDTSSNSEKPSQGEEVKKDNKTNDEITKPKPLRLFIRYDGTIPQASLYNILDEPVNAQRQTRAQINLHFRNDLMAHSSNPILKAAISPQGCSQLVMGAIGLIPQGSYLEQTVNILKNGKESNSDNQLQLVSNEQYDIVAPIFQKIVLKTASNKDFTIQCTDVEKGEGQSMFIQSAKLNGQPYTSSKIDMATIERGGTLQLVIGKTPNKLWGKQLPVKNKQSE
ncbi:MAG: hypothetical protein EZS28_031128 [Streblomastix strix]|uniref:Glycosyl hydrolase family 92 domain-containing protein n=1 Tax=Streblomastix strix TaxID=222440 RepID=A0A5J4USZ1_9EUKA|nr:MAG: hypothetical protein EZS28_031128 [Streblomastix strix]